jgi:hypothetical protein
MEALVAGLGITMSEFRSLAAAVRDGHDRFGEIVGLLFMDVLQTKGVAISVHNDME